MNSMPSRGHHYSGPAATHAATQSNSVCPRATPRAPPPYSTREPSIPHRARVQRQRNYVDEERRPLLSSPPPKPKSDAMAALLILGIVIIWPIAYFAFSLVFVPSQVALYKNLYDDARAQVNHLMKEKATLVSEVDNLRGQLNNAKVETFWEIARTMDTNMDVWVGADDPGGGPKFWAYGITNGKQNEPPVTTIQITFSVQGTVVESTDDRRVIGYRVKSNRWNNGWWMATGLNEFGEPGYHRLQFAAREGPPHNGAAYEAVIYYARWT